MKTQLAYHHSQYVSLVLNLSLQHRVYNEQWRVTYNELQGEFWEKKSILYCTENKDMAREVLEQFTRDFKSQKGKLELVSY